MTDLYVIVDPEHCGGRDPLAICEAALRGGAAALQLRAKALEDRALLALARAMRERCRAHGVPFWVNDRADIALLCTADGLHLGQDDLPLVDARSLSPSLRLGLSTHSLAQARAAAAQAPSLIGFGPVFDTQTKSAPAPTQGIAQLTQVCRTFPSLDVVAIGGIRLKHAPELARSGARYAAVISAIGAAPEPEQAARSLRAALAQR